MLLKHRPPGIDSQPARLREGLEHLEQDSIAVLRWLNANKVDFVVIGPVARAIRGDLEARGPVAIVPAPYGRNYERLCTALVAQRAGLRADLGPSADAKRADGVSIKLTADKLARGKRWMLRLGAYDLDIDGVSGRGAGGPSDGRGTPGYQELLYEARREELAPGLAVQVASPEDVEHYSHVGRTGVAPEFRVIRKKRAEPETA